MITNYKIFEGFINRNPTKLIDELKKVLSKYSDIDKMNIKFVLGVIDRLDYNDVLKLYSILNISSDDKGYTKYIINILQNDICYFNIFVTTKGYYLLDFYEESDDKLELISHEELLYQFDKLLLYYYNVIEFDSIILSQEQYDNYIDKTIEKDNLIYSDEFISKASDKIKDKYKHLKNSKNFDLI